METKTIVEQLGALAQETRLAAWRLLVEAGPSGLTVGTIGETLGIPPATLSFHLKTLANAGLISTRQEGRFIHCVADFAVMHGLLGFLGDNCCGGADCSPAALSTSKKRKSA
jgi:DNA-binding transcriptional ArsR family regulator